MFKQNRLIYAKEQYDDWVPGRTTEREFTPSGNNQELTDESALTPDLIELLERSDIKGFELTPVEVQRTCEKAKHIIDVSIREAMLPVIERLKTEGKVDDATQARTDMTNLIDEAGKAIDLINLNYARSLQEIEAMHNERMWDPTLANINIIDVNNDYLEAKANLSRQTLLALADITGTEHKDSGSDDVQGTEGMMDQMTSDNATQVVAQLRDYVEKSSHPGQATSEFLHRVVQHDTMTKWGDNPIDSPELQSVVEYASSDRYFGHPAFANAPDDVRSAYQQRVIDEFSANLYIQEHEDRDDTFLPDLVGDDMSAESVAWQFQDPDPAKIGDYEPTYSWNEDAVAAGTTVGRTPVEVEGALFGKNQAVQLGQIPTFEQWHEVMFIEKYGFGQQQAKEKIEESHTKITDFNEKTKDLDAQIKKLAPAVNLGLINGIGAQLIANTATLDQAASAPLIYYTDYEGLAQVMSETETAIETQLKNYRDALLATLNERNSDIESFKDTPGENFSTRAIEIKAKLEGMGSGLSAIEYLEKLSQRTTETQTLLDELDAALQERFEAKRKEQLDKLNGLETLLKTTPFSGVEGVSVLEEQRQDLIQKVTEAKTEAEIESLAAEVTTFIETVKAKELEYKKETGQAIARGLRDGGFASIPEESELKKNFGDRLDAIDTALAGSDIEAIDDALEDLTKLEEEITAALVELAKSSDTTPRSGSDAADRTSPGIAPVPTPSVVDPGGASPSASGDPAEEPEVVDEVPKDSTPIYGESGPGEIDTAISALLGTDSTPALIAATLGVLVGPDGSSYVTNTDGNPVTLDTSEGNIYKRLIKAAKAKGGIRIKGEIIAVAKSRLSSGSHSGDLEKFKDQKEKALETTSSAGSSSGDDGLEDDDSSTADDAPESREHTPARTREEIIRIIERSGTCDMASIIESVLGPDLPEKYREELRDVITFFQDNGWKKLSIGESKTFFNGDLIITRKAEDAFEIHFNNIRVPGESQDVNIYIFVSDNRLTFNIQIGTDDTAETLILETSDRVEQLHGLVLEPMEEDDLATRKAIKLRELRDISGLRKREMENFLTFQYKDTVDYSTALEPSQSLGGLKRGKIRRQSIKTHFDDVSRFDGGSVGIPGAGESNRYVAAIDDLKLQVDSLRDRVEFPNLRNLPISAVIDILVQAEWADEHSFRLPKGRTYHTEQVRIENNGRFALRNNSDYQFTYRPK